MVDKPRKKCKLVLLYLTFIKYVTVTREGEMLRRFSSVSRSEGVKSSVKRVKQKEDVNHNVATSGNKRKMDLA